MDREQFWKLIERAREHVGNTKDIPAFLIGHLAEQPTEEISSFGVHLGEMLGRAKDGRLWLAVAVLRGGCSNDCFDYFRGWLVAKGKDTYEMVLQEPDRLAAIDTTDGDYGDSRLEDMARVPSEAYSKKLGNDEAEMPGPFTPPAPVRNSEFLKVRDDDDTRLRELFPKLFELRESRRARKGRDSLN